MKFSFLMTGIVVLFMSAQADAHNYCYIQYQGYVCKLSEQDIQEACHHPESGTQMDLYDCKHQDHSGRTFGIHIQVGTVRSLVQSSCPHACATY